MRLADVAPRLALARDQWFAEQARIARADVRLRSELLKAERLVAHRELQLLRAGVARKNRGRYVAERQRKLNAARRALARITERWESA